MVKVIEVKQAVLASSRQLAAENRKTLDDAGVTAVNIMASPGAGKTTLIVATAEALRGVLSVGVVEGDVAGDIDALLVEAAGFPVVQINTGGACHLRADMMASALEALPLQGLDLLFIENVGNLICPAGVALGESFNVVLSSTPEGDDKPAKYPSAFRLADAICVTKWDIADYVGFKFDRYEEYLRRVNSRAPIFRLSAANGDGMNEWLLWLKERTCLHGE